MTVTHPLLAPLGSVIAFVVVLTAAVGDVGFGSRGWPLANLVAAASFLLAALAFLFAGARARLAVIALSIAAGAVVVMHLLDPSGPVIGPMLVAAFAPLRPNLIATTSVVVVSTVAFNATQLLLAGETLVLTIATDAGVAFFYLLGTLLRREQRERERANRLVLELERSRAAERAALAQAERTRVARDLHDILAHTLSGLTIQLEAARVLAEQDHDPRLRDAVERAHALSRAGMVEARRAVGALRGSGVPGPEALPALLEEHRLATGAVIRSSTEGEPRSLPGDVGAVVFRVAQEALSNVRKHAASGEVDVRLTYGPEEVRLLVRNPTPTTPEMPDGAAGGFGIIGMAERAESVGGTVTAGISDGYFLVTLSVPAVGDRDAG